MALVGDLIVQAREAGPDPASFLGPPTSASITDGGAASGALPGPGGFWLTTTAFNQWGESIPLQGVGVDFNIVLGAANHSILISNVVLPPGAIGYRVYMTPFQASSAAGSGTENGYFQVVGTSNLSITSLTSATVVTGGAVLTISPGVPPVRSSAMLPDTDGGYVSASTMYRWLNNALQKACKVSGGLPLLTGVQAISATGMYRIPGRWIHFTNGWFDQWPITFGRRSDVWMRNPVSSISGMMSMEESVDMATIQLWPQPNRTGATTTLNSTLGPTNTQAVLVSSANFLPIGLVQIENEIMQYYNATGNALTGMLRGLGGTIATTHPSGATVTELNIRLSGFKIPDDYEVGDSAKVLPIPPAWDEPLSDYMAAQFKKTELDVQAAIAVEKQFEESIKQIVKESRPRSGPVQIGSMTREVYPGGYGGGILIP